MRKHISICLEFAGIELPVGPNEKGEEVVPLKPISDLFGLEWNRQYKRMQTPEMVTRMGTCIVHMYHAGQRREMLCIRLKRVIAFLYSINPGSVKAAGNIEGAEFLEAKQAEWDDVLHAYEEQNGIFATEQDRKARSRSRDIRDFISLFKAKKDSADDDRKVFDGLLEQQASILGVPYQKDLIH